MFVEVRGLPGGPGRNTWRLYRRLLHFHPGSSYFSPCTHLQALWQAIPLLQAKLLIKIYHMLVLEQKFAEIFLISWDVKNYEHF